MSELKTIVFARGQNESIDPRVLPDDQHKIVKNVRFRKDGRPQKRPALISKGIPGNAGRPNFIAEILGAPLIGQNGLCTVYSSVAATWSSNANFGAKASPFVPGNRLPVYRNEYNSMPCRPTSTTTASGLVLFAWENANSAGVPSNSMLTKTMDANGAFLAESPKNPTNGSGAYPRLLTVNGNTYLFYLNGASLEVRLYVAATDSFAGSSPVVIGPVVGGGAFDVCAHGTTEFLVVRQTSLIQLTAGRYTAVASPALAATAVTLATNSSVQYPSVSCTSTSSIFIAWLELTATPSVRFAAYDSTLTTLTAAIATLSTTAGLFDQPGIVVTGNTAATVYCGKFVAPTSFLLGFSVSNTAYGGSSVTHPNLRIASKPFTVTAASSTYPIYMWCHTPELDAWEDQRSTFLLNFNTPGSGNSPLRHLFVPSLLGAELVTGGVPGGNTHLAEVVDSGAGFWSAQLSQLRTYSSSTLVQNFGLDAVLFYSQAQSQFYAARDTVVAGSVVQIGGGSLVEHGGSALEETGFASQPVIVAAASVAGGALTPSSTYIYKAVFEYLDASGRRARSATSDPFTVATTAANFTISLTISPCFAYNRGAVGPMTVHIYRTLAGQSTYHRVTPNCGAPATIATETANIAYSDNMADSVAQGTEFIYTDGGVLDHTPPPPCRFLCLCNGRVWLGGQFDRNVITASKLLVAGEPTQFSSFSAFNSYLARPVTGIASIDGTVVAFALDTIFLVTGDGPNNQGVGSFNPPSQLPTDVGCVDWRSVVETSQGVFFQGQRGIFLLPRGFGAPQFVGAPVEDTLRAYPYVTSATLVSPTNGDETTVRFTVNDDGGSNAGAILIYNLRTGGWIVDVVQATGVVGPGGTWQGKWVQTTLSSGSLVAIYEEPATASYAEGASNLFIPSILATGDVRPFGVAGYGNFNEVTVMGEYRGNANVIVSVSVDGVAADSYTFAVTSADAADGVVYLGVTPKIRKGCSIAITVQDAAIGGTATEGFIAQAVFLEVEAMPNGKRLAAARRA